MLNHKKKGGGGGGGGGEESAIAPKLKVEFPGMLQGNLLEFPWVLVLDCGISNGFHTIFQNFQG